MREVQMDGSHGRLFPCFVAAHMVQRGSIVPHIWPTYHKILLFCPKHVLDPVPSSVVSELRMSLQGNDVKLKAVAKRAELTY